MKEFKGRIVASGTVTAKALVSHGGLNTLASFQKALQFGDKKQPAEIRIIPTSMVNRWRAKPCACRRHRIYHRRTGTLLCLLHEQTAGMYAVFRTY